jgi:hypothetical protein
MRSPLRPATLQALRLPIEAKRACRRHPRIAEFETQPSFGKLARRGNRRSKHAFARSGLNVEGHADFTMLLALTYLLIEGAGAWSFDAIIAHRR